MAWVIANGTQATKHTQGVIASTHRDVDPKVAYLAGLLSGLTALQQPNFPDSTIQQEVWAYSLLCECICQCREPRIFGVQVRSLLSQECGLCSQDIDRVVNIVRAVARPTAVRCWDFSLLMLALLESENLFGECREGEK